MLPGFFHSWHRKILFPSGLKERPKTKHENSPKPGKGQDKNSPVASTKIAVFQPESAEDIKAAGKSNYHMFLSRAGGIHFIAQYPN
ncbi:MAG: hypothetical protein A2168_07265 [Planctomycetes bacterium RBG_13_50_24]|nr:MAG: hypothetical protein A2168_07265 [Planctomycetes bacterium RBG_13_50_24]